MPRKGKPVRLAEGIYRHATAIRAIVKVGSGEEAVQRERWFPPETTLKPIQAWQDDIRGSLRRDGAGVKRGTLAADALRYLRQVTYLGNWTGVRSEVRAWTALYGKMRRGAITPEHVRRAMAQWIEDGYAPKTVNNRRDRLRTLYRTLDARPGRPTPQTPCDTVDPLTVADVPAVAPQEADVTRVAINLEAGERHGRLRDAKTRARFLVIATTGKRPAEVMRAEPPDLDLDLRVWQVRNAKGGIGPGIYLNDDMLAAWRLFVEAEAWGAFETSSYARVLRTAGWPANIRPYNLRHSVGHAMSQQGVDLADIQAHYGHAHISTTRKHYVPVLNTRLVNASQRIDGRFSSEAKVGQPEGQPFAFGGWRNVSVSAEKPVTADPVSTAGTGPETVTKP